MTRNHHEITEHYGDTITIVTNITKTIAIHDTPSNMISYTSAADTNRNLNKTKCKLLVSVATHSDEDLILQYTLQRD